jgi:HAD superfamily hydrolase (TIGR01490 family)
VTAAALPEDAVKLAIFDLDNTLIGGDSDYLWGQFLAGLGVVDAGEYLRGHDRFYADYLEGTLDIHAFLRFQLAPLARFEPADLLRWRTRFIAERIRPIVLPRARTLLDEHRAHGHTLLIVTATNRFITAPIAELLGVAELIATEPESVGGRFTGEVAGTPSYAAGKVVRFQQWLAERDARPSETWFYSDSHNDLPLLERVTHPVAVDPDETLAGVARARGWPVLSLR